MRLNSTLCLLALLCAATVAHSQTEVRTNVKEVKDTRTTGQFFGGLDVKLLAIGEFPRGAKAVRFVAKTAEDELGTNLLKEEEEAKFDELSRFNFDQGQVSIDVKLLNPPRRAQYVKELSGTLELFIPSNDENATLTIENFKQRKEPAVSAKQLEVAKIKLVVMSSEQYEQVKKEQQAGDDVGEAIGAAFGEAFESMFSGFGPMGKDSIVVKHEDPNAQIISIEFVDSQGKKLDSAGRTSMGDTSVYKFTETVPDNALMKVYLRSDKAIVAYPVSAKDIALP